MNTKLVAALGTAAVLVMLAPAQAHHVVCTGSTDHTQDPCLFDSGTSATFPSDPTVLVCDTLPPLPSPAPDVEDLLCGSNEAPGCEGIIVGLFGACTNDVIAGLTVCEQNADPAGTTPANAGQGGLWYMSTGWADATNANHGGAGNPDCVYEGSSTNDGRSNGLAPQYDQSGSGAGSGGANCQTTTWDDAQLYDGIPAANATEDWYTFQMTNSLTSPTSATFHSQVNGIDCAGHDAFHTYVNEQFVYEVSNGHVSGFPGNVPAAGDFGSYTTAPDTGASFSGHDSAGDARCDNAAPWFQG